MNYAIQKLVKPAIVPMTADQGAGRIMGTTQKKGIAYPFVPVCVFKRSNRQLLWETTSKADGSYTFRNLAVGLECFVTAFDPKREYNAVIADGVKAK